MRRRWRPGDRVTCANCGGSAIYQAVKKQFVCSSCDEKYFLLSALRQCASRGSSVRKSRRRAKRTPRAKHLA